MATATELKNKIIALNEELARLTDQLHEATIAESPVKVGQIYTREVGATYKTPAHAVRGQVVGFSRGYGTKPILRLYTKDGTLGKRETDMWAYQQWTLETTKE